MNNVLLLLLVTIFMLEIKSIRLRMPGIGDLWSYSRSLFYGFIVLYELAAATFFCPNINLINNTYFSVALIGLGFLASSFD